jgi:F-type H+-transporting ATPase subunit epsilon
VKSFIIHLQDATHSEQIEGATSFIGQDASGSFGIQADHEPLMTILQFGLGRFRLHDGPWEYIAVPEAILSFAVNALTISSRRYLRNRDFDRISQDLEEHLRTEEREVSAVKEGLRKLQDDLLRRLWQLGREAPSL